MQVYENVLKKKKKKPTVSPSLCYIDGYLYYMNILEQRLGKYVEGVLNRNIFSVFQFTKKTKTIEMIYHAPKRALVRL